jgi:transcriptional regulator with XRE-family HTH domain
MPRFISQAIKRSDTAGLALKQAREERNFSLKQVAARLNIPADYLEALEASEWEVLPQGDYGRYFLREYAKFLNLDPTPLLEQYPGPNLPKIVQPPKRAPINPTKTVHPMRRIILAAIVLALVIYLIIAARAIFMPPQLSLASPAADATTIEPVVVVAGTTQPGTEVTVNNEGVEVLASGSFNVSITLRPGLNTLTVKAKKNLSREAVIVRRIFYSPPTSAANY